MTRCTPSPRILLLRPRDRKTAFVPAIRVKEVAGLRFGVGSWVTATVAGVVEAAPGVGGSLGQARCTLAASGRRVRLTLRLCLGTRSNRALVGIAEDVAIERSFLERVAFGFMPADQQLGSNAAQRDDHLNAEVVHASQQARCYPTLAFDVEAMVDPVFGESERARKAATLVGAGVECVWRSRVRRARNCGIDLFSLGSAQLMM